LDRQFFFFFLISAFFLSPWASALSLPPPGVLLRFASTFFRRCNDANDQLPRLWFHVSPHWPFFSLFLSSLARVACLLLWRGGHDFSRVRAFPRCASLFFWCSDSITRPCGPTLPFGFLFSLDFCVLRFLRSIF